MGETSATNHGAPPDATPVERASLQEIALAGVGDAIVITDREGHITWTNPAFTRLTGYAAAEVIGQTPRILKSGRQKRRFYENLWATILSGRRWRGRIVNRRKDGTCYVERQTITPVADENGRITNFVVVKQDVTGARKARRALRDRERMFRSLLENALDIITVMDPDGTIRYESPAVERVLGYAPEDLVGRNALAFIPEEDRDQVRRALDSGRGTPGYTASLEFRFRHRDGSWRTFEGVGKDMQDDPVVRGIIVNSRDVTERKRAEEELRRQREARYQSERLADMGTLLAGVAHELNNPLSVVIGYGALVRSAVADGPLGGRVDKLVQAAERCARIVRNFLALARQHPPQREAVRLNQIVLEAIELLAYPLRVDTVDVVLELGDDLPMLWADPHQLHQVLVNLITNAHQAMRAQPVPRQLTVRTRAEASPPRVFLEVRDNGPGIDPEVQARLFEPFFTTKPPGQGTGLGLSLCRGIVEAHEGRIEVESRPGGGALCRVALPVVAQGPAGGGEGAASAARATTSRRILVVDDEGDVAEVLADFLRADGHAVQTVTDGATALERIRSGAFDLAVIDVRMPDLDGPALYRALERSMPAMVRHLVFMTGDTLSPGTREFLDRTGVPTLVKPFGRPEIRQALAVAISGR